MADLNETLRLLIEKSQNNPAPLKQNPKKILLLGRPKTGKTTATRSIPGSFTIELEPNFSSQNQANMINLHEVACALYQEEYGAPCTELNAIYYTKLKEAYIAVKNVLPSFEFTNIIVDSLSVLTEMAFQTAHLLANQQKAAKHTLLNYTDLANWNSKLSWAYLQDNFRALWDLFDTTPYPVMFLGHSKTHQDAGSTANTARTNLPPSLDKLIERETDATFVCQRALFEKDGENYCEFSIEAAPDSVIQEGDRQLLVGPSTRIARYEIPRVPVIMKRVGEDWIIDNTNWDFLYEK